MNMRSLVHSVLALNLILLLASCSDPVSGPATSAMQISSAPVNPWVAEVDGNGLHVEWMPPAQATAISGYRVTLWGSDIVEPLQVTLPPNETSVTFFGIVSDRAYVVQVETLLYGPGAARENSMRMGAATGSSSVFALYRAPWNQTPRVPLETYTCWVDGPSTELRWIRPADSNSIVGYEVRWRRFDAREWQSTSFAALHEISEEHGDPDRPHQLIHGLDQSLPYFFSVITSYSDGTTTTSNISWRWAIEISRRGTAPLPPTDIRAEKIDGSRVRLRWNRPYDSGPIDYRVKISDAAAPQLVPGTSAREQSTIVEGLLPGAYYYFYIYSVRHGIASEPVTVPVHFAE